MHLLLVLHFQEVQWLTNPPASAGDTRDVGSIPRSGRSPEVGNGNPLSILAWEMPWTEEPCGLQSVGSQSQTQLSTRALPFSSVQPLSRVRLSVTPMNRSTPGLPVPYTQAGMILRICRALLPCFFFDVLPFLWSDCIHTHTYSLLPCTPPLLLLLVA